MFGLNTQTAAPAQQDTGAIDDIAHELPVGGDDLLASTNAEPTPPTIVEPSNTPPAAAEPVAAAPAATPAVQPPDDIIDSTDNSDLINIKREALQQLTPLVGHLDQTPEEKFRTTMMLIQATDDKTLLQSAYDSALKIPDEKSRAQALLDVVNEINYFTHPEA
jgi:hypothetical protein